jgi:hypothetical protein
MSTFNALQSPGTGVLKLKQGDNGTIFHHDWLLDSIEVQSGV